MILSSIFKKNGGYNLLGLILAITLSTALFSGLFLSLSSMNNNQYLNTINSKFDQIEKAISLYKLHKSGVKPTTLDQLVTTDGRNCIVDTRRTSLTFGKLSGWCGPYIDAGPLLNDLNFKIDSWGNIIQYDGVTLRSCGPNNLCHDGDDIVRGL